MSRQLRRRQAVISVLSTAWMGSCRLLQVLRHMCEGLVALLMDRADYNKYMMRSVARDLLASLVFRPMMQHLTPYNINKVLPGFC